jgi:hypothetical protein
VQYVFLCYHNENEVFGWSKQHEAEVIGRLQKVEQKLAAQGRLGPVARLMPTSAATTLLKNHEPPLIVDGPFAETKEQLLGFYVIDCKDQAQAVETAQELGIANPGGAYEFRPLLLFNGVANA